MRNKAIISATIVLFWLIMVGWFAKRQVAKRQSSRKPFALFSTSGQSSPFDHFEGHVTFRILLDGEEIGTSKRTFVDAHKPGGKYTIQHDTTIQWEIQSGTNVTFSLFSTRRYLPNGTLKEFTMTANTAMGDFTFKGEKKNSELKLRSGNGDLLRTVSMDANTEISGDLFSGVLYSKLQPGTTRNVKILQPFSNETRSYEIQVARDPEQLSWNESEHTVHRITISRADKKEKSRTRLWVTKNGKLLKQRIAHPLFQKLEVVRKTPLPENSSSD